MVLLRDDWTKFVDCWKKAKRVAPDHKICELKGTLGGFVEIWSGRDGDLALQIVGEKMVVFPLAKKDFPRFEEKLREATKFLAQ